MTKGVTNGVTAPVTASRPRKAVSVERLLHWAYGVELVRGVPSDLVHVPDASAATARGSGCHPDALVVDQTVTRVVAPKSAAIVRTYAFAGMRPDWKPLARHRLVPRQLIWVWYEGKQLQRGEIYEAHPMRCHCGGYAHLCSEMNMASYGRGEKNRNYTPVIEADRPDDVTAKRHALYVPWFAALEVIRNALRTEGRLASHTVTEVLPHPYPWLNREKTGRVICPLTER